MNEESFRNKLLEFIKSSELNKNYEIKENNKLLYRVIVNKNLKYTPKDPKEPLQTYVFETDLLITKKENNLPLVVIETKWKEFSTHDVLIYSTKALKHKEIYPYLRYGLVVGGKDKIDYKFFIHNAGFDFAFALEEKNGEIKDEDGRKLIEIINEQLECAKTLLGIFVREKKDIKIFNSVISIPEVKKKEEPKK